MTVYSASSVELYVNAINATGAEGHSLIITPKKGANVGTGDTAYSWWRSATFEWSDEEEAYIVRSVDLSADGVNGKNNVIPENGFVLLVNIGNDYGNISYINKYSTDTYNALASVNEGDKAYLTGIDLAAGRIDISGGKHYEKDFVTNAVIYIGDKPADKEIYTPDTSLARLASPSVTLDPSCIEGEDLAFTWDTIEGAEYYTVNVNTSAVIPDGKLVVANTRTEDNTFSVPAGKLTVGYKYTVSVTAHAKGARSSYTARAKTFIISERAARSPLLGKTVVAFGDSLTAFTGWVSMLPGELGTDVINAGVGGDKTTEAVARLQKDVIDKNPDVVLIMFGMNDQAIQISTGKPLVSEKAYERNYRKIIEAVINAGAEPVLMTCGNVCTDSGYYVKGQYGLDYGTGNIQNYFAISRRLAEEYGINLIDINAKIAEEGVKDSKICAYGDGIHLSAEGQKYFTRWISDYFYDGYFEREASEEESSEEESSAAPEESAPAESSEISEPAEASEQPSSAPVSASEESSVPEEGSGSSSGALVIVIAAVVAIAAAVGVILIFSRAKKK